MNKIIVSENEQNKRLDNLIAKKLSKIPKSVIFKWIRIGTIKVNNKKVNHNYKVKLNDVIDIKTNISTNQQKKDQTDLNRIKQKLDIIYEDKNIIIINKPIGILSQDDSQEKLLTIQNMFLKYLLDKNEYSINDTFTPSICNRLDRNTSGIIIAAKNLKSLQEMNELIKNREIEKYYLAMVFNKPIKKHQILEAYHYKNNKNNIVYISDIEKPKYKKIITEYWLEKYNNKYLILKIKLITGKTHQIRAHLNHIGLNIVGDRKYKNKSNNHDNRIKHQALVSYKLIFRVSDKYPTLKYLNNKKFEIKKIWFEEYFH